MAPRSHRRMSLLVIAVASAVSDCCVAQHIPDRSSRFSYMEPTISPEKAEELSRAHTRLTLDRLEKLSPAVAAAVAEPRNGEGNENMQLTLNAVREISEDAARELAKHSGSLFLPAVDEISAEAAKELVGQPGTALVLDGLQDVSPEVAQAMTGCRRMWLKLGIKDLRPDIAAIFAQCDADLAFPRLKSLSLDSAKAFQTHGGPSTTLDFGQAVITPEVAEALLARQGPVGVSSADRFEPGVGDILARHKSSVVVAPLEIDSVALARKVFCDGLVASSSVRRLRTMSLEIAAEYVRCHPGYLKSLDTLSVEAARELAKDTQDIELPAITRLSPELATVLTDRKPAVYLRGIRSLDGPEAVQVAEALASTPAPIYVEFLERVSARALAVLRTKPTIKLPPDEKLTIVP